ncbi:MAG: 4'-phosphopantetheinyl transferase superfamily protein [Myxococcales bacterium]|nr:4'-phosphopantetheinyl transferase superfamily protein [Myxococcales bacterium]
MTLRAVGGDDARSGDRWQAGPYETEVVPAGLAGEARIWLVDPDDAGPYGDVALLSPDELRRADRFIRTVDRRQFVAAHTLLRTKLGLAVGRPAADLQFQTGPHGRPELVNGGAISFSLSHTTGLVGCAIATGATIGLDLELLRPLNALGMAQGILDPSEYADVATRTDPLRWRRFLQYWTLKEAALKVRGTGLSLPADQAQIRWSANDRTPRITNVPDVPSAVGHRARIWQIDNKQGHIEQNQ